MIVYLIRHGTADDATPATGDTERKLTQQGTLRTALVAKGLSKIGLSFDRIISSPYTRARETAAIVARITEYGDEVMIDGRLSPFSTFEDTDQLIKENADVEHLLLVGHQPCIGVFVSETCAENSLEIEITKASVTAVEIDRFRPHCRGRLLWSLPPKLIERLVG